jgi:uncharacterized FlgJ-related protein
VLPAVLHVNEEVRADRAVVEQARRLIARGEEPDAEARGALERIAEDYGVDADDTDRLLDRVDVVPVSLALAQAAIESGWGTSRFAQHGNALFGQRSYGSAAGLKPAGVVEADFRVRSFSSPANSVATYLRSLNTHPAYETFRQKRADMRRRGATLDAHKLAATLTRYSERGAAYVADVRTLMQTNRLKSFGRRGPAAVQPVRGSGMRRSAPFLLALFLSYATGCANLATPAHRAATASAIGAGGGLAIGLAAGAPLIGALVGGGAGAAIGLLTYT